MMMMKTWMTFAIQVFFDSTVGDFWLIRGKLSHSTNEPGVVKLGGFGGDGKIK
jgi:hypothetical protein